MWFAAGETNKNSNVDYCKQVSLLRGKTELVLLANLATEKKKNLQATEPIICEAKLVGAIRGRPTHIAVSPPFVTQAPRGRLLGLQRCGALHRGRAVTNMYVNDGPLDYDSSVLYEVAIPSLG